MNALDRKFVPCSMCGGKYSLPSMPFHWKACAKKRGLKLTQCAHCSTLFPPADYNLHQIKLQAKDKPEEKPLTPEEEAAYLDARIPCGVCGRKFIPDRHPIHEGICKRLCRKQRRPFDSFEQRRLPGWRWIDRTASQNPFQDGRPANWTPWRDKALSLQNAEPKKRKPSETSNGEARQSIPRAVSPIKASRKTWINPVRRIQPSLPPSKPSRT